MTKSQATVNDRRRTQRFAVSVPLTVNIGERQVPGYTRDLSNRGVYFYLALSESKLIDSDFEFLVDLPPEITLSTFCRIRCSGRLLRRENASTEMAGIAAEILKYSIVREPTLTA
jgi:hypothetical protein